MFGTGESGGFVSLENFTALFQQPMCRFLCGLSPIRMNLWPPPSLPDHLRTDVLSPRVKLDYGSILGEFVKDIRVRLSRFRAAFSAGWEPALTLLHLR